MPQVPASIKKSSPSTPLIDVGVIRRYSPIIRLRILSNPRFTMGTNQNKPIIKKFLAEDITGQVKSLELTNVLKGQGLLNITLAVPNEQFMNREEFRLDSWIGLEIGYPNAVHSLGNWLVKKVEF